MINFEFIQMLEGSSSVGYVPDPEHSASGVTIASGFDLGARTERELCQAFPIDLASKLLPYASLKSNHALNILRQQPLVLSSTEVSMVNHYAKQQATERLITQWNSSLDTKRKFEKLPEHCQTVIASVAFQYGYLRKRTPNFWRQVTAEDWSSALKNLRRFGDRYPTRRNKEADLLEEFLSRTV